MMPWDGPGIKVSLSSSTVVRKNSEEALKKSSNGNMPNGEQDHIQGSVVSSLCTTMHSWVSMQARSQQTRPVE